jgi:ParB-like chromosome segregation protein Spo0J
MSTSGYRVLPLAKLRPYPRNTRTHPTRQIEKLARLMKRVGFINPIVTNERLETLDDLAESRLD